MRRSLAATAILAAACGSEPAPTPPPPPAEVVASVNGVPITRARVEMYARHSARAGAPEAAAVIEELINMEVLAQQAERLGLERAPETADEIHLQTRRILAAAAAQARVRASAVPEAELRAAYEAQYVLGAPPQYRATHALFEREETALKAMEALARGTHVEDLGRSAATRPLRVTPIQWMEPDQLDGELAAALAGLAPGTHTPRPLRTAYGWHVLRLDEVRRRPPPAFESVRDGLVRTLQAQQFQSWLEDLRRNARIERAN